MGGQDLLILIMLWQMIALETGGGISKQRRCNQFMELATKGARGEGLSHLVSCSDAGFYRPQEQAITAMTYRRICCV